jgi:ABC-2 type transport system ATP-binding protein
LFGLNDLIDTPTSGFSHGQSRRLSVALATLGSQYVLILDEPFDGVDPIGVKAINETIKQAREHGVAIIISTHLQNLLVDVSDRILVMKESVIAASEPSDNFKGEIGEKHYRNILEGVVEEETIQKVSFFTKLFGLNRK